MTNLSSVATGHNEKQLVWELTTSVSNLFVERVPDRDPSKCLQRVSGLIGLFTVFMVICLWQILGAPNHLAPSISSHDRSTLLRSSTLPLNQSEMYIRTVCSISGTVLILLLAWLIHHAKTTRRYAEEISAVNHQLMTQIAERTQADEELLRAKSELENKIAARTADIAVVNDYLHEEVVERKRAEAELIKEQKHLREQRAFLRQVIDTATCYIFVKDAEGRILLANSAFAQAYGMTPQEMIGRLEADVNSHPEESEAFSRADRDILRAGTEQVEFEESFTDCRGDRHVLQTVKRPLSSYDGAPTQILGICTDITAHKELEIERERLLAEALDNAEKDSLTGLANHRAFHRRLNEEADRAQRTGSSLAIAMIDLNNFKFFNDCYGHPVGDEVLKTVATALNSGNRTYDTLARFGGDEFALLLPGMDILEAANIPNRIAERLSHVGYTPSGYDTAIPLSAAVGVAIFPQEAPTRGDALDLADARLRRTKAGKAVETEADRVRATMARTVQGFSLLDALVIAVDGKDRYTRRHSEDVLTYSLQIANALNLDEQTCRTISVAALLHDVGKIGVPDNVLRKPGRLTEEEFDAIKQHPIMGAAIVGAVPGFEDTLDVVRHHHERWDGKGYPLGLVGNETPLMARLTAVADAFSAMTTDRPYRKGMSEDRALALLEEGAGTQWDPVCVSAFVAKRRVSLR